MPFVCLEEGLGWGGGGGLEGKLGQHGVPSFFSLRSLKRGLGGGGVLGVLGSEI